jgi:hypothetical protein
MATNHLFREESPYKPESVSNDIKVLMIFWSQKCLALLLW